MSGRYLLDSNIVIALFAGEMSVLESITEVDEIFIPSIVVGELYYGAQKSHRRESNIARIDDFVEASSVLDCDQETARRYGEVKQELQLKGRPIPENDIWIAAVAIQYGLALVTRDVHFQEVDMLEVEAW